jgi:hypothetical protein
MRPVPRFSEDGRQMVHTAGATIGGFAESARGARFDGTGIVNNDVLNTAIAAGSAVLTTKSVA